MDSRDDRPELIHPGGMGDRFTGVLRVTREAESLGAVEGDRVACFARRMSISAREGGLFGGLGLRVL